MSHPVMIYKAPGRHLVDRKYHVDYKVVDESELLEGGFPEGWHGSPREACVAYEDFQPDDEPPTRQELETKALDLGIEFSSGTRDATLAKKIAAALKE